MFGVPGYTMAECLSKTLTTLMLWLVMVMVMVMVRADMVKRKGLTQCHNLLGAYGREGEGADVVFCRFLISFYNLINSRASPDRILFSLF